MYGPLDVMSAINIRRDVDDKFYRYKMPSLIVKVETVCFVCGV